MYAQFESLENRRLLAANLLNDFNPVLDSIEPNNLISLGDKVLFTPGWSSSRTPLYVTDGTAGGTKPLAEVSIFGETLLVGDTLYFVGVDRQHSQELWKTDGTEAGTVPLTDVSPDSDFNNRDKVIQHLTSFSGEILFSVKTNFNSGTSLWLSDGTIAGTRKVTDQGPQYYTSGTVLGDKYYYGAWNGEDFRADLWVTDGTAGGTHPLFAMPDDVESGADNGIWSMTTIGANLLIFTRGNAGTTLFLSDGTEVGTQLVKNIPSSDALSAKLLQVGGVVYFDLEHTTSIGAGTFVPQLWRSDGTAAGTFVVESGHIYVDSFIGTIGSKALFFPNLYPITAGVWSTDGTPQGTVQIKSVAAGADRPSVVKIGQTIYFKAGDASSGSELWRTDGTALGTELVTDLNPGAANGVTSTTGIVRLGDRVVFGGDNGATGSELWAYDPAASEDQFSQVFGLPGTKGSGALKLQTIGNTLFFFASDNKTINLWKTDGTHGGTVKLASGIGPGVGYDFGGTLFIVTNSNVWRSDGTTAGTKSFFGTEVIQGAGIPSLMLDGKLYVSITANYSGGGVAGTEARVYVFDNPSAAPRLIWRSHATGFAPYVYNNGPSLFAVDGKVWFKHSNYRLHDPAWYSIDGDAVTKFGDAWPGPGSAPTKEPAPITDSITIAGTRYYAYDDGVHGKELWKDDGTGAQLVQDLYDGPTSSSPDQLAYVNGRLFFVATSEAYGREPFMLVIDDSAPPDTAQPSEPAPVTTQSVTPPVVVLSDPAPTYVLTNGLLVVSGTGTAENIVLRRKPTNKKILEVVFDGVVKRTFTATKVTSIQIDAGAGNDQIHLETLAIAGKLNGGLGNDLIYGSSAADRINGGAGDDVIYAGAGNDSVYGDSGRDKLFGEAGKDYLVGGAGKDAIRGGADLDRIIATIGLDDIRENVGDIITNVVA